MTTTLEASGFARAQDELRTCLLSPIPEISIAARLLDSAVSAHMDRRFTEAASLIERANIRAIYEWADSLIGPSNEFNTPGFPLAPSSIPSIRKEKARMPSAELNRMLHDRDGYNCRFCGTPIIRREVRKRLVSLYPLAAPWGDRNAAKHALLFVMEVQYDHIVPHCKGGRNDLENLVVTCLPCNYGRSSFTIEEMGLCEPRTRQSVECIVPDWDGLERLLAKR